MDDIENLWPTEIGQIKIVTPNEILLKQAEFLSKGTKNLLEASVVNPNGSANVTRGGVPLITLNFIIKAPSIGYRFNLLGVEHGFDLYPAIVVDKLNEAQYGASNEEEFKATLSEIFNSPKVVKAINALTSQSVGGKIIDDDM